MEQRTISVSLGALAPDLKKQLKGFRVKKDILEHLQKDADAITRCAMRELSTDSQTHMMRGKLMKKIQKAVSEVSNSNKSKKEKQ